MYQKLGYEYRLFSRLNFPGASILIFYDVIWWLHCCIKRTLILKTIAATVLHHKHSKWRRPGNSNAKTADIHIQVFCTLKLSFHL